MYPESSSFGDDGNRLIDDILATLGEIVKCKSELFASLTWGLGVGEGAGVMLVGAG